MNDFKRLVHELEDASEGSAFLDAVVAAVAFPERKLIMLPGEPHWITRRDGFREDVPLSRFTTSLDSARP